MDDETSRLEALARARIFADPRKFCEYVLVPGHPTGQDRIFLGSLGYRPFNVADAWELARLYEAQAQQRIASNDVQFAGTNRFGARFTILINVREVALRTGWLLNNDVLRLTAPFSGFARGWKGS